MNAIIFIRHGQSKTNITNTLSSDIDGYPLTDEGVKQVETLAKTIPEGVKIDSFYTSPILVPFRAFFRVFWRSAWYAV